MKIVTKAELLKQPQGVLFADYENTNVGELSIYGGISSPGSEDFVRASLGVYNADLDDAKTNDWREYWLVHMEKDGGTARADFECFGRDGAFEDEALYVLLDKEDVTLLLKRVAKSLTQAYGVVNPADLL